MRRWIYGGRQLKVQLVGSDETGKSELLVYLYQNGINPPTKKLWELIAYEGVPVEYPRGWELILYSIWGMKTCALPSANLAIPTQDESRR